MSNALRDAAETVLIRILNSHEGSEKDFERARIALQVLRDLS